MAQPFLTGVMTTAAILSFAGTAVAQDERTWTWSGHVAAGKAIEIKNVNGDIQARPGSGSEIQVRARKYGRDNPDDVRIEVIEHSEGVTICAVYPDVPGKRPNECGPSHRGRMNTNDTRVTVDFEVTLPAGVTLVGQTVNGSVIGRGLQGDVFATTVNGEVDIETTGWGEGVSVNGDVRASVGRADWQGTAEFTSVNGGITLTLPAELNTEVRASTVNGDFSSDFPLTVQGRFGPRRISGTIGSGGRHLELTTVNGSIQIRKR